MPPAAMPAEACAQARVHFRHATPQTQVRTGLHAPAHTCAHTARTRAGQGPRVCAHMHAHVCLQTQHTQHRQKYAHARFLKARAREDLETKGKEAMWPVTEAPPFPWGKSLGEQGEGGSTVSWGRE